MGLKKHIGKLLGLGALALVLTAAVDDAAAQERGRGRGRGRGHNPPTAVPELDPAGLAGAIFVTIGGALVLIERRRQPQA